MEGKTFQAIKPKHLALNFESLLVLSLDISILHMPRKPSHLPGYTSSADIMQSKTAKVVCLFNSSVRICKNGDLFTSDVKATITVPLYC